MEKTSFSRLLLVFLLIPALSWAGDEAKTTTSVGEVVLIIGDVVAMDAQGVRRTLTRGAPVYVKDTIETAVGGHAHLHFVDDGVVSIRPQSRLEIDLYVFDPANPAKNSVRLNLKSGVLRSLSGKATQASPDRFRLNTPITAVGVLGTDFMVRAEADKMWAAVFSGTIAVAPLDGKGCLAGGLGVCVDAIRLSAGMGDLMFEYDAQKGVQHVIERDGRVLNPGDISTQQGTDRNGRDMSASEVNAAKVVHTRDAIGLSPFAWGRWHGEKWPGDALSQTFKNASLNRNVTVGSRYYALFREDTEAVDLPWVGSAQYDFNLSQGQVHFVEKTPSWVIPSITPGQIDDGRLSIDFVNQRFNTHIEMSHPEAGSAVLDLGGSVNRAGKFAAHDATGMAAGAVSANGGHAGLLFERALDAGVFQGISNWERK